MKIRPLTGRIDPKRNSQIIAGWKNTARHLWLKACEFDGINVDSKFVVFSDENKYSKFYDQAMSELRRAISESQAGGYIGLTIRKGGDL